MPHLLLVDDDDLFRESLGLDLVDEGYEVTSFDNGRDALAYPKDGSADVMLLDWRMPNLTGIDVPRRMRGAGITIPVIFLTVLSDDIYGQAALEGGAVDFIDKARRLPILLKRLQLNSIEQTYISKTSKKRQNCKQSCGASTKSLSLESNLSTILRAGADWNARRARQRGTHGSHPSCR